MSVAWNGVALIVRMDGMIVSVLRIRSAQPVTGQDLFKLMNNSDLRKMADPATFF